MSEQSDNGSSTTTTTSTTSNDPVSLNLLFDMRDRLVLSSQEDNDIWSKFYETLSQMARTTDDLTSFANDDKAFTLSEGASHADVQLIANTRMQNKSIAIRQHHITAALMTQIRDLAQTQVSLRENASEYVMINVNAMATCPENIDVLPPRALPRIGVFNPQVDDTMDYSYSDNMVAATAPSANASSSSSSSSTTSNNKPPPATKVVKKRGRNAAQNQSHFTPADAITAKNLGFINPLDNLQLDNH
jgi:hypothetical protein